MKNKQKVIFTILGIAVVVLTGIIFVSFDRKSHAEQFKKEKDSIIQKTNEALGYTIDNLKTEIVYLRSKNRLSNAHTLFDLSFVANLLNPDKAGFDSYNLMRKSHPEVFHKLLMLGQKFFVSEMRMISSQEELEKFRKELELIDDIVPIYSMDLGGKVLDAYWEKVEKFGK